jgi:ABC-type hemin transport system substrate-binding protein
MASSRAGNEHSSFNVGMIWRLLCAPYGLVAVEERRARKRVLEPSAFEIKVTYRLSARASMFPPSRIVCLTDETVETLYLLGEQDRIVGISGYVVRPPQARREKPRVSAFTSANIDKILPLRPDRGRE